MDDDDTPTLVLDDHAELLAYLPYRFGFRPRESAVLVGLRSNGAARSLGLVARVDLSDLGEPAQGPALRARLFAQLRADRASTVVIVLYTQTPVAEVRRGTSPAGRALRTLQAGGPWAEPPRVLLVSATTFRCLDCASTPCCPGTPRPVSDLTLTRVGAQMVWEGVVVADSREALAPQLRADPVRRAEAMRASARERRRRARLAPADLVVWRSGMLARWHRVVAAAAAVGPGRGAFADPVEHLDDVPAAELGALLTGLEDVHVRDAVLLSLAAGVRIPDPSDERAGAVLESIFAPGGPKPALERARAAQSALVTLASLAARHRSAAPLGMLAWLAWWCGEGARTDVLVRRCLAQDPGHRLARLLLQALEHGMGPGWARSA